MEWNNIFSKSIIKSFIGFISIYRKKTRPSLINSILKGKLNLSNVV
jgi:hypothetical protein